MIPDSAVAYTMDDLLHIANDWLTGTTPFVLSFDGVDDYVEIANDSGLNPAANSWTTSFRMRSDTASQGAFIISKRADAAPYQIQLWYVDHRSGKEGRRMTYDDGKGNVSDPINGHSVIGEFTADNSTVPITITATAGTNDAHLNAYQIRELSE